jgi:hypothetical protein
MCWFPRRPWRLRIRREGYEHIIRCGECPGCLEFDRRRLCDRLCAHYPDRTRELWLVRIAAPAANAARLCHNLHRRSRIDLEPGFFRLGTKAVAVIARSKAQIREVLRRKRIEHSIERIRLKRGRRAWFAITSGLLVAREHYGKHVNRWYVHDLREVKHLDWEVESASFGRGYERNYSPRATKQGNLLLVPDERWKESKLHRMGRKQLASYLNRAGEARSALADKEARARERRPSLSLSLPSKGEGYRSSVPPKHWTQEPLMPGWSVGGKKAPLWYTRRSGKWWKPGGDDST